MAESLHCSPETITTLLFGYAAAAAAAKSLQSCPTLCDLVDCILTGLSVMEGESPGKNTGMYWAILVAIPFSVQFSSVQSLSGV